MSTRGVLDSMGVPAVDLYQTSIEMENGTIAQMENGWIVPDGSPALIDMKCTVLCRRGMVKINGSDSDLLRVYSPQRMETPSCIARPEINDRVAGFAVDNLCCFAQGLLESRPSTVRCRRRRMFVLPLERYTNRRVCIVRWRCNILK